MKIVFLGEYSSLFKNIKAGLLVLGHDAIICADTCGFMSIQPDVYLGSRLPSLLGHFDRMFVKSTRAYSHARQADVVQLISPLILPKKIVNVNKLILSSLCKSNNVFLTAAGDDSVYIDAQINRQLFHYPYTMLSETRAYDDPEHHATSFEDPAMIAWNDELVQASCGVIPAMYEYAQPYRWKHPNKLLPTIPLPMDMQKIEYKENRPGKKLVFFHGLNRYGFKGTRFVEAAFAKLQKRYPNDVECIIDGKMPLAQYLELLKRVNVAVDQVLSYTYGMNAVYSMAMGHVVLAGNEPQAQQEFGCTPPVVNIVPDVDEIYARLVEILDKKDSLPEMGYASRQFAEQFHSHIKVAQQYVDVWRQHI